MKEMPSKKAVILNRPMGVRSMKWVWFALVVVTENGGKWIQEIDIISSPARLKEIPVFCRLATDSKPPKTGMTR